MSDLYHECGVAAVYHLPSDKTSELIPTGRINDTTLMLPRILLDIQNRGQLAAGMTSYNPDRNQLIDTHKNVGTVTEVFSLNHQDAFRDLMSNYEGQAAIGHVRYATCGKDDRSYAQPFERHHLAKSKWFSFAFNGQLANYQELRDEILSKNDFHLARETDTEIIMHLISQELSKQDARPDLLQILKNVSKQLDGAYNIVFLNALGDMVVARDPLGIRPLVYAREGDLFAAASESVALTHLGFAEESIISLEPGEAIIIQGPPLAGAPPLAPEQKFRVERFAESPRKAHCFFEWIYFANVGSTLDDRSVYLSRKNLGEELARVETIEIDEDTVVVPVPDTAKAAADSMAFQLKVPSVEGLIRNRYIGRTFIEGTNRADKVRMKYTPLPEVLRGKRVLLVEDSIVRSTTMMALISQLRERGGAKEIHVRVACPPILSPCFYGIDMSTKKELFAARHMAGAIPTPEEEAKMAKTLGADTLRYLPIEAMARCVGVDADSLCQACVDSNYPTEGGKKLYQIALQQFDAGDKSAPTAPGGGRTYDTVGART